MLPEVLPSIQTRPTDEDPAQAIPPVQDEGFQANSMLRRLGPAIPARDHGADEELLKFHLLRVLENVARRRTVREILEEDGQSIENEVQQIQPTGDVVTVGRDTEEEAAGKASAH